MKVLVLCDDRWHPAETVKTGLEPLKAKGFHFDFIEDAKDWSEAKMKEYPVVILSKSNNISAANDAPWVTEPVEQAFAKHLEQGGGLLVIHSGTAGYSENKLLRSLIGGVFDHHPEQCEVTMEPVKENTLTEGCNVFTMLDEHYFMQIDDTDADIIMTTRSKAGVQPGGWTRKHGRGRVCVLTPGHNVDVWTNSNYQKLICNSLIWCGGAVENQIS